MADTVRVGLVGLGNMGAVYGNFLKNGAIEGAELAAVCSTREAEFAKFPDVKAFTDSGEMIRSGAIDAILIATPHFLHTTIGSDALNNGVHALVDKPLSVHKKDCERLIAAHTDKSLVFCAMFNQRTDPRYITIKRLIDSGELGALQRISWIITDWYRPQIYFDSAEWRATWKGEGGGVLVNQCPHQLDLWQWMFGLPSRVTAICKLGAWHDIEVEDEVTAMLDYDAGYTGVFITSTGEAPGQNRLEIAAERGQIILEGGDLKFTRNEVSTKEFTQSTEDPFSRPAVWNIDIPIEGGGAQHQGIIQNFVDAIRGKAELMAPGPEGVRSVELANAMLLSSEKKQTVALPIDSDEYESLLNDKIANSTHVKKVREVKSVDMGASFNKK